MRQRQHFVPQYYFRHFSQDTKRINLLTLNDGTAVKNASIRHQCCSVNFYGDHRAEKAITEIEHLTRPFISSIHRTGQLPQDRLGVATAVLFQHSRSRLERELQMPAWDALESWMRGESSTGAGATGRARPDAVELQLHRMKVHFDLAPVLTDLKQVLLVNKTQFPFVFSDSPVVIHNPAASHITYRGTCGLAASGLQLVMPVDPRLTLMIYDAEHYLLTGPEAELISIDDPADVHALNTLQLHNAGKAVYFGEYWYSEHLRKLWAENLSNLKPPATRMEEVSIVNGDSSSEAAALLFQPQVRYRLQLSCLSTVALVDDGKVKKRSAGSI